MKRGFSLIELLIVVSIIGILSALALPKYQDALVRANVAGSRANLKLIDSAIQQLQLDRNVMLVDLSDGLKDWGQSRIEESFYGVGKGQFPNRNHLSVLSPLTSPIPYMQHIPHDPFLYSYIKDAKIDAVKDRGNILPQLEYMYIDHDPEENFVDDIFGFVYRNFDASLSGINTSNQQYQRILSLNRLGYYVKGYGPKQKYKSDRNTQNYTYFPVVYNHTNGVVSDGILILVSGEGVLH